MRLTGHVIGLLKEYMQDLVEQARQETEAQRSFGFTAAPYRPDHAISDLLAILTNLDMTHLARRSLRCIVTD